jgi:signal peptidase I
MKIIREVGIIILIAIAIFALLRVSVQGYVVRYSCMLPNIESGEWIMVNKASFFFSDPKRGDVVVFRPPFESEHPFIKRVIGLPGETIEVKQGKVLINGILLKEKYIMEPIHYNMPSERIPEGEYFVLGDNRNNSNDSHTGWTVPREKMIGRAWFVYWPPAKWKVIKHYNPESGNDKGVIVCIPVGGIM